MEKFLLEIMSEDPDKDPPDNHQKYYLDVEAVDAADAKKRGEDMFKRNHADLPIHNSKAYKCNKT